MTASSRLDAFCTLHSRVKDGVFEVGKRVDGTDGTNVFCSPFYHDAILARKSIKKIADEKAMVADVLTNVACLLRTP